MPEYPIPSDNPKCVCPNPMAAMFCMTGHMLECHYPMSCSEAECSHWAVEMEYDDPEEGLASPFGVGKV